MLGERIKTAVQFAKSLRTVGALYETSRQVEIEITTHIDDHPDRVYVEYGLGHGNITKEILSKMHLSATLYSFEVNQDFCKHVGKSITDKRLIVINDSATHLKQYVTTPIDGIISSLPLTILPKAIRTEILKLSYDTLKTGSYFSQILYSKRLLKKFIEVFDQVQVTKNMNLPMEYIHHCLKSHGEVGL